MNSTQLVPVFAGEIQGEMRQLCNARDLHTFIESKRQFSDWIKGRIDQFGFVEGEDFTVHKFVNGRTTQIDYHLSIDMAKELAMVENNDKGRRVRRYFIEVEKRANETFTRGLPSIAQQLSAHGIRLRLLDKLEAERHPEKRRAIHQQLDHASRILGLDTPALDAIGRAEAPQAVPALVETFWDLVDVIGLDTLNHSRDPRWIAIRMYDFEEAASKVGARIPPLTEYYRALRSSQSPRFITIKPVNSALVGKSVRCWVFEDVAVA